MAFGTQIDDLLDTLGSATSEEVETALQKYSMRDIVGVLVQRFLDTEAEANSGSSSSQTATVTTDPNTFLAPEQVFDLGAGFFGVALVTITGLTLTGDGETFGNDPGTIYAGEASPAGVGVSSDPSHFVTPKSTILSNWVPGPGFVFEIQAEDQSSEMVVLAGRYLSLPLGIVSNDTGEVYAGANNPTAEIRIDISYK